MSSSSMTPFTRSHHTAKRFNNNNVSRLKVTNHHSMMPATISTSLDINNNSNNPGAVFAHYEHGHADSILEALNELRLSKHLCDVTIIVDQHEYACHKVQYSFETNHRIP